MERGVSRRETLSTSEAFEDRPRTDGLDGGRGYYVLVRDRLTRWLMWEAGL